MSELVSIILCTYNGARYLRESLDSCLEQTYSNIELVVVNDGSTDDTLGILRSYSDPRIIVLDLAENRGFPEALNIGFSHASGGYLTFTSDDNRYAPEAIEEMYRFLCASDADFVYTDYYAMDEEGNITKRVVVEPPESLAFHNRIGACFLFQRSVYEKVGCFDPKFRLAEDYDYWVRVWKQFTMQPLHKPLYYYRLHSSSLTAAHGRRKVARVVRAVQLKHLAEDPQMDPAVRGTVLLLAGCDAHADGDLRAAEGLFAQALELAPHLAQDREAFHALVVQYMLTTFGDSPTGLAQAAQFVTGLFAYLPPVLKPMRLSRSRLLAHLHIVAAFAAYQRKDRQGVVRSVTKGVFRDPQWLLNRGVCSILLQGVTGFRREERAVFPAVGRDK